VPPRKYDAICLDLDGTLVTDQGSVLPRTVKALRAAEERGVRVMIATGRSEGGTIQVLEELGLSTPALVYNGAGFWCPVERRMIEERVLSNRTVAESLAWADEVGALAVVMQSGAKYVAPPRTPEERGAISQLEDLHIVPAAELPREVLMRITLFSGAWPDSGAFHDAFVAAVRRPTYLTHFPLCALVQHRGNPLDVVDVQPPCRGKGEALRYLTEAYGIPPERVVCVGDAGNDVPMLAAAGLAVAMENAFDSALAAAHRVIGSNNTESIAELVEELFLDGVPSALSLD
jgi:hydroxymethylpyrimidine pyrophosphatase-like HAD family hydrolase